MGVLKPGIMLARLFGYSSVQRFRDAVIKGEVQVDLGVLYNDPSERFKQLRQWVDQAFEYGVEAGAPVVVMATWDLWFFGFRTGEGGFELEIWGPVVTHQPWSAADEKSVTVRGVLSYISAKGPSMPQFRPSSPNNPRHGRLTRNNLPSAGTRCGSRDDSIAQQMDEDPRLMYPDVSKNLPYVHLHDLDLGRVKHRGPFAVLRDGLWGGMPTMFKFLRPFGWKPVDGFVHETIMYKHLQSLHGGALAYFLGHGLTFCSSKYFMALERVLGVPLSEMSKPLPDAICSAAEAALDAVHNAGVVHGDLHAGNILVRERTGLPPRVVLIDFEHAELASSLKDACQLMQSEKQLLHSLLR